MSFPPSVAMATALAEAQAAAARGEVPIGAAIVDPGGRVIAQAGNRTRELNDPTAHAELLAIREAGARLGSERLIDCDMFVTLEPCPMCAAAIGFARLRRDPARRVERRRSRPRAEPPRQHPRRPGDAAGHLVGLIAAA